MLRYLFLAGALAGTQLSAASVAQMPPSGDDIIGRIECVTWRQTDLERRLAEARRDAPGNWTPIMQMHYEALVSLDIFTTTHIRPWIDQSSQYLLVQTYWPDGADQSPGVRKRCAPYRDAKFLRAPVVIGVFDLPEDLMTSPQE